ncbi:MAG: hypothetical protein HY961_20475 [Ignavibacteriae bacterium]|nr:hypothetical protein [Ignavibacteriota bacterium]
MRVAMVVSCLLVVSLSVAGQHAVAQENSAESGSNERPYFSDIVTIQQANFARLERMYAVALTSENDGVVESALAHAAVFKLLYPIKEFAVLHRAIEHLEQTHASSTIRHWALVVDRLYESPEQFARCIRTFDSPDDLFDELGAQLSRSLVGNMK